MCMKKVEHINKHHNRTLLLYHLVFPVKYRRKAIDQPISETIKQVCLDIEQSYEVGFIEIGTDNDHVHFLVQGIPNMSVTKIVTIIKSVTAIEIFRQHKEIKKFLYGGNFWTSGYYANSVGLYGNKDVIQRYVQNQGKNYTQIYQNQLNLFDCFTNEPA